MKRILVIISIPFVIAGLIILSAVTLIRAAAEALLGRAGLPIANSKQPQRREVI